GSSPRAWRWSPGPASPSTTTPSPPRPAAAGASRGPPRWPSSCWPRSAAAPSRRSEQGESAVRHGEAPLVHPALRREPVDAAVGGQRLVGELDVVVGRVHDRAGHAPFRLAPHDHGALHGEDAGGAAPERVQLAPQPAQGADEREQVLVPGGAVLPGEGPAVVRVVAAPHADLVAVVDAGRPRRRE